MKMYRPNFYYQITEQLHGTTMGTVMTLGGRQGSGRGWVLGDCWSSPRAGRLLGLLCTLFSGSLVWEVLTYSSSFQNISLPLVQFQDHWDTQASTVLR